MPTAAKLQWPQGQPLFEVQWRAVAESLAGNGVRSASDLKVTATATDLEIQVASGTAYYLASESTLGAAETHTLSAGDGTHDRWDTVYIDTSTDSSGVREGTPAADPEPKDVQGDELLLAVVYVPSGATDVPDSDVLNWRAQFSNEAEEVHYDDSTGTYSVSSVDAALDELQEAAQISAHPLAIGDLASPYGLPVVTDMDVAGTDLTDSSGPGVLYESSNGWFRNEVVQALTNLTGDEQFTQHPLALADLASPYAMPNITDMDVAGNDLSDAGTTIWNTTTGQVPRGSLDDERTTTAAVTTDTTTSAEEVLLVDTSGGPVTITLASADLATGNVVTVVDVGGSADTNSITVDTEGSENIDGGTTTTVDSDYGATVVVGDANSGQWYTAGGGGGGAALTVQDDGTLVEDPVDTLDAQAGLQATTPSTGKAELAYEHREVFQGRESGSVSDTNQGILVIDHLADGETVEVYKAVLTLADGQAAPSGLDLNLVTLDNAGAFTSRATLISGDGSTVFDDETGSPLASYTNSSGGGQTVGVLADNATGNTQDIMTVAVGVTGA